MRRIAEFIFLILTLSVPAWACLGPGFLVGGLTLLLTPIAATLTGCRVARMLPTEGKRIVSTILTIPCGLAGYRIFYLFGDAVFENLLLALFLNFQMALLPTVLLGIAPVAKKSRYFFEDEGEVAEERDSSGSKVTSRSQ